jgi:hypothetical protein
MQIQKRKSQTKNKKKQKEPKILEKVEILNVPNN